MYPTLAGREGRRPGYSLLGRVGLKIAGDLQKPKLLRLESELCLERLKMASDLQKPELHKTNDDGQEVTTEAHSIGPRIAWKKNDDTDRTTDDL